MSTPFPRATLLLTATIFAPFSSATPTFIHASDSRPSDDGDDDYNLIVGLADKDFDRMVVKEARRFLEEHASHPKADLARYRLANALFDLGNTGESRPHFARLDTLREFQFAVEVAFRLGQCELEAGKNESAAEAFQRVIATGSSYLVTPATFLLGEASIRQDDFAGAQTHYEKVLASADAGEYAKDAAHGLAWCAFRLSDYDLAIRRIQAFLQRFSEDERVSEMRFLMGEAHFEAQRPEEALAVYGSVQSGPFHDAALRGAGFAAAALGRHTAAAEWFGKLLANFPESRFRSEVALQRGIHLLKADAAGEALGTLRGPDVGDGAEVQYWRGRTYAQLGRHEEALGAFEAGLAADGPVPDELQQRIQVGRGDALFELGRKDEAAAAYQSAGSDYALHAAAVTHLNEGEAEEAVRLARSLVDPARKSVYRLEAQLTLGEGLFALEQYEPAEAAFRVVADEGPDDAKRARATARIGWCRWLRDDYAAAAESFGAVAAGFEASPEASESRFMRARALDKLGESQQAIAAYADYLQRHAEGQHRAEALLRLARLEPGAAGEQRLAALLASAPDSEFSVQGHFDLAERCAQDGRFAEARPHYQAVVEAGGELAPPARYGLGWCLYSEGSFGPASEQLQRLGANDAAGAELREAALELCVWAARKSANPVLAQTAFTTFAERCEDEPRRFAAAQVAATALKEAERFDAAQSLWASLLERTRDRDVAVDICVERAYLYLDRDATDSAEEQVRAAHQYAPDDEALAEAIFFVGEARFAAGADAPAAQLYVLSASSGSAAIVERSLYKGGFACLRQDDHDGAVRAFTQLVASVPKSELVGESFFLIGEAHYRAGRFKESVAALRRLRAEHPKHETTAKALFRLGLALARTEQWREAADELARLTRDHKSFENLLEAELWRGRALAALDERRGARQALARVVQGDRGVLSAQARIELGRLALASGEAEEALSEFLKVAVLYAHDEEVSEALYLAGQVLEGQGDRVQALAQYDELLTKHPKTRFAARAKERVDALRGGDAVPDESSPRNEK
ncbi:MAG: tetratricopeptide repeat protein [bacterium]|nr:tetratricopeptide repeat protein [bacterium]